MRKELRETIHACNVPCIIVTHDLRDVACIGDRACLLERGKIALTGGADEVMGWGAGLPASREVRGHQIGIAYSG